MPDTLSLDAIFARYELEPSLIDIYVEGDSDKMFLDWFLSNYAETSATVYPIDLIEIPESVLAKYKLKTGSNRSKVAALSAELHSRFGDTIRVICIVDRDFEDYLPSLPIQTLLALTDGNSFETYFLNEQCFHKLTALVLGGFGLSATMLLDAVSAALRELYAIRLTNEKLGWGMTALPLKNYVSIVGNNIEFRKQSFVIAYLLKNGRVHQRELFDRTLVESLETLPPNIVLTTRGHDISELLLYVIRRLKPDRKFGNPETLEGTLLGTIETHALETHELFRRVRHLLTNH